MNVMKVYRHNSEDYARTRLTDIVPTRTSDSVQLVCWKILKSQKYACAWLKSSVA